MSLWKLINKWKSYRFRFVPWIIFNLSNRIKESSTRLVPSSQSDTLIPPEKLEQIVIVFLKKLKRHHAEGAAALFTENNKVMLDHLGFAIDRKESKIPGGGTGVFITAGAAKKGAVVALYPGTIYRSYEPILLPSLNNSFVFRCLDGTHIDGKDRGLSKIIFKSVAGRDRMGPMEVADTSWLGIYPLNPWSVGQYVNNSTRELPCNVAYQEFDLQKDFPPALLACLPYALYSPGGTRRVVALVATVDINQGSEVLSSYYTLVAHKPIDIASEPTKST